MERERVRAKWGWEDVANVPGGCWLVVSSVDVSSGISVVLRIYARMQMHIRVHSDANLTWRTAAGKGREGIYLTRPLSYKSNYRWLTI